MSSKHEEKSIMLVVAIFVLLLLLGKSSFVYLYLLLFLPFILVFGSGPYRAFSRFLIYDYLNCDMIIPEPSKPTIYVCNYPSSWIDYCVPGIFPSKICILASSQMGKYFACLVVPAEQVIVVNRPYVQGKNGKKVVGKNNGTFEKTLAAVREKTNRGFSVMCYVDSSAKRSHARDISELYHGMFAFSRILNVPIQPVALDYIRRNKLGHLLNRRFWMNFGRPHIVENEEKSMNEVRFFLQSSLEAFIERENEIKD